MKPEELSDNSFPDYYKPYINLLPQKELLDLLKSQKDETINFMRNLKGKDMLHSYAEGKWTLAEVIQHMIDTERIFQYRALCISRKDRTPLPGYDQDAYVPFSGANERSIQTFIDEYQAVRTSGIHLFSNFTSSMLMERGNSNGKDLSAGAAGFIIVGHEKHHLKLFKTSYNL
jgi:hypothetical protein